MNNKVATTAILFIAIFLNAAAYAEKSKKATLDLTVTENGFEPKSIDVKPGTDVTLKVARMTDSTCAKQIQVPPKKVKIDLPLNKPVTIALGKLEKGEIKFGCGMEMMESGKILVK